MEANERTLFTTARLRARALAGGDEETLQRVFEDAGDYFLTVTGRPEPDPDAAGREIRACEATPGREIALLALEASGEPVGAIGWWSGSPEPDLALLGMILLLPAERGKGLAREAVDGLAAWLGGEGIRRLRTGVGAGDERVHALLRGLGFSPLDQRKHVSLDRGRVMLALFERELGT